MNMKKNIKKIGKATIKALIRRCGVDTYWYRQGLGYLGVLTVGKQEITFRLAEQPVKEPWWCLSKGD